MSNYSQQKVSKLADVLDAVSDDVVALTEDLDHTQLAEKLRAIADELRKQTENGGESDLGYRGICESIVEAKRLAERPNVVSPSGYRVDINPVYRDTYDRLAKEHSARLARFILAAVSSVCESSSIPDFDLLWERSK